jgi:Cu/Ag efflux protein CusF
MGSNAPRGSTPQGSVSVWVPADRSAPVIFVDPIEIAKHINNEKPMSVRILSSVAVIVVAMAAAACGDNDRTAGDADGSSGTKPAAQVTEYQSHGVLKQIDAVRSRVVLDHEQIGAWMEPMAMPFPIADPGMLEGLEVGKRYAFTVAVDKTDETNYTITRLEPAP